LTLSRRYAAWRTKPAAVAEKQLHAQATSLPATVDAALGSYDFRAACQAITALAEAGNRFIEAEQPWQLAKAADAGDTAAAGRFEAVIDAILTACRIAADELAPFIPDGAARLQAQLDSSAPGPSLAFRRITEQPSTTQPRPAPAHVTVAQTHSAR
jgi:methionyl-tRNA synthetase